MSRPEFIPAKDQGPSGMLARLGDVIYWAATTFAGLVLLYFLAGSLISTGADISTRLLGVGVGAGIALICWLIGRAARYVLSRI